MLVRPLAVNDGTGRDKKTAVLLGIEPRRRFVCIDVENQLSDFSIGPYEKLLVSHTTDLCM